MKKHHTVAEFLLTESFGDHHPQHGHRTPTEIAEDEIRDALPRDCDERQSVRKVIRFTSDDELSITRSSSDK